MRASIRPGAEKETPTLIAGRYRVEHPLGKGGAAHVFCVTDTSSGRKLALKRLHPEATEKHRVQFEREYQTLASFKHPRIVEAFEYGADAQGPFYTMELLEGEDLKQLAPVPWREACAYMRDAAEALGVLHARRLLHRDVSPRNLWRTPDGRVKLIDFGTLVSFGVSDQVIGTPPHIAPEVLLRNALDQRSDLYSLGGVAYYMITGLHAYPARDLRELPSLWQSGFRPASQRVAELNRADLPAVPEPLDHLLAALLDPEVLARPPSAEALIDRLDVSFHTARPSFEEPAHARLSNSAFVGRTRELRTLRQLLAHADAGNGQCCLIESEPGMGRSRLLRELTLEAAVRPSAVLLVDAAIHAGMNGVAEALALKLLATLPEAARAAAEPYAEVLAQLAPRVAERLGITQRAAEGDPLALRVRLQHSLSAWFLSIAEKQTLVLAVDGLEAIDDASVAFLHALALGRAGHRLLIVCALMRESGRKLPATAAAIVKLSQRLVLGPLDAAEVSELLGSVFGEAMHLNRLANKLQRAARGNPRTLFALSEQLVRSQVLRLVGGAWIIPRDLPEGSLSWTHEQAVARRIAPLPPGARELGGILSVHEGPMPLALARTLATSVSPSSFSYLGALLDGDFLVRDGDAIHVTSEPLRAALLAQLAPATKRLAQRQVGALLLADPHADALVRLKAGTHLLKGGDPEGAEIVARTALHIVSSEVDKLGSALPSLETALALFRAAHRPFAELLPLLVPLTMGGYYKDLRYAHAYGDVTVAALEQALALPVARTLRHVAGGKRALRAAKWIAEGQRHIRRHRSFVPSTDETSALLFRTIATLVGASAQVIDAEGARRYAEVLRPYAALGENHPAALQYELCATMALAVTDAAAKAQTRLTRLLAKLEHPSLASQMPPAMRMRFIAAVLHAIGVRQGMLESDEALRTAERLDKLPAQLHKMQAEQVRTVYYAHQGNHVRLELSQKRLEQHAIQQGTLASTETWTLSTMIGHCVRTYNAIGLKRISQQLSRLAQDIPQLVPLAQRAWSLYLLIHGKYDEAVPALESSLVEKVRSRVSWGRNLGLLAQAYNRLGDHQRARDLCLRAVSVLDPGDRAFPSLSLTQQAELLIAETGLGRVADAREGLAELIAFYAPRGGPLTMGQLHQTGLEMAFLTDDRAAQKAHLAELERWYASTGVPSLVQHCKWQRQRVEPTFGDLASAGAHGPGITTDDDSVVSEPSLYVERLVTGGSMTTAERAQKALSLMVDLTGAAGGLVMLLDARGEPQLTATLREEPSQAVLAWLRTHVDRELTDEVTQLDEEADTHAPVVELMQHDDKHYRAISLTGVGTRLNGMVGVVALVAHDGPPRPCPTEITGAIGYHLQRALMD